MQNRRIYFIQPPKGSVSQECFDVRDEPMPELEEKDVLVRNIYLSCDPYMRGRMSAAKSYAKPVEIGGVMEGGVVGEVLNSNFPGIQTGDLVVGSGGWQEYLHQDWSG